MSLSYTELQRKFANKDIAIAGREYYEVLVKVLTKLTGPGVNTLVSRGLITDFIFLSRLLGIGYQSSDKVYIPISAFEYPIILYPYGWVTDTNLEMSIEEFEALSMRKVDILYIKNMLSYTQSGYPKLGIFDSEYKSYIDDIEKLVEYPSSIDTSYIIWFICILIMMDKTVLCENERVLAIDLSDLSDNAVEAIKRDSYMHNHLCGDSHGKSIFIPRTNIIFMGMEDVINHPDLRYKEIFI